MNGGNSTDSIALAHAIAAARKAVGLTQQDLCMKANLSYSTLAKIERGAIKTPSVFTVAAIAAATNTSVESLTGIATLNNTNTTAPIEYKTSKTGIKFVYFDVNGVFVRFYQRAFTDIAHVTGASADTVEALFWHYNDAICRGEMSLSEFDSILARRLRVDTISWAEYYLKNVETISQSRELIAWASQYYPVGLLTNIMPGLVNDMIRMDILPNIAYNSIVDSSVVGAIKPELGIYEAAQNKAGFSGGEILFIDDSRANLMAAERLGWKVLWFDDYRPEESENRIRESLSFN